MSTTNKQPVTRVYTSYPEAREAIGALETGGVSPRSISVMTRSPHETDSLEHVTGISDNLEYSTHRNRLTRFVDWLGRVESAAVPSFGGMLGTGDIWQDVQQGGTGRGAITGALVGCGVPVDEAARLEQEVQGGKILVIVHGKFDASVVDRVFAS